MASTATQYVLGIDIGSTTIKGKIFDQNFNEYASASKKVETIHCTDPAAVELDPIFLNESFIEIVKTTLQNGNISANEIVGMGICCQRSNIIVWDRESGKPMSNLISWQDVRSSNIVAQVNSSWMLKAANIVGSMLYFFLRQSRFLVLKIFEGQCNQAGMRLYWLTETNPEIKEKLVNGKALFGTLDTWLIWNLTKGEKYITDYSNAGGTGMYDLFIFEWSQFYRYLTGVDIKTIAPTVCDTSGKLFTTHKDIFGCPINVTAIVGDCPSATFGLRCFNDGDVACTFGTGLFFQINTALSPKAGISGMYPQIGWRMGDEYTYMCELQFSSFAVCMEWAKQIGLFENVEECSEIARNAQDSDGLYFVPGFHGLRAPYKNPSSCAGFIGIKTTTTKQQMLRAVLEGMAFIVYDSFQVAVEESNVPISTRIRVCGGVSRNNFLLELVSSLTGSIVERAKETEMSLVGAVFLAGLGAGVWQNKKQIEDLPFEFDTFYPDPQLANQYHSRISTWKKAVSRFLDWYER